MEYTLCRATPNHATQLTVATVGAPHKKSRKNAVATAMMKTDERAPRAERTKPPSRKWCPLQQAIVSGHSTELVIQRDWWKTHLNPTPFGSGWSQGIEVLTPLLGDPGTGTREGAGSLEEPGAGSRKFCFLDCTHGRPSIASFSCRCKKSF